MAKKYTTIVAASVEKMYADNSMQTPIVALSQKAWNGTFGAKANYIGTNGKGKFEINRMKRIKDKASDTSAAIGDQIITRLNAANKIDWETIDTVIGTKRDFLVAIEEGDIENFSENPADFKSGIEQAGKFIAIRSEEIAIENIITNAAVVKISLGDQSAADLEVLGEKMFEELALQETDVSQVVDEFIHMGEVVSIVSPYAAKAIRAYKGTAFQVDKSSYADSITPSFTLDNSTLGFVDRHFDKFLLDQSANGGVADEKIVAIVMKPDAYFDPGLLARMKPLDTKLLDITLQGHSYWGANKVVDPSRIVVITAKTKTKAVTKVGA